MPCRQDGYFLKIKARVVKSRTVLCLPDSQIRYFNVTAHLVIDYNQETHTS